MKKILIFLLAALPFISIAQRRSEAGSFVIQKDMLYLDIRAYGADTSKTDNHDNIIGAIVASISMSGSAYIYVPHGRWKTSSLDLSAYSVTILMQDSASILQLKSGSGNFTPLINLGSNSKLINGTFDNNPVNTGIGSYVVYAHRMRNIVLDHVTLKNSTSSALNLDSCTFVEIHGGSIDSTGAFGAQLYDSKNVTFDDGFFLRGWGTAVAHQAGISITGGVFGVRNILFQNCKFFNKFNSDNFAIETSGYSFNVVNLRVLDCDFNGNGGSGGSGTSCSMDSSWISRNYQHNTSGYCYFLESGGSYNHITDNVGQGMINHGTYNSDTSSYVWITGNMMKSSYTGSFDKMMGIGGSSSHGAAANGYLTHYFITDNIIDASQSSAQFCLQMLFYGGYRNSGSDILVDRNTFIGNNTTTDGIYFLAKGNNDFITVSNNRWYKMHDVFYRDTAAKYYNTRFINNIAPNATSMFHSTVDVTNFPNAYKSGNITDTTIDQSVTINNVTIGVGKHLTNIGGVLVAVDSSASGGSGASSVGAPSGTSTANGGSIASNVLTLNYGDGTNPGIGKLYTTAGTATDGSLTRTAIGTIYAPLTSPSFTTPTLGVATGTSFNKVTITAPATSATLTLITGSTLQTTGAFALNLTTTAASTPTFPSGTGTLAYIAGTNSWTGKNTFTGIATGYVAKTAAYTLTTTDQVVVYTTAGFTATLPTAVGATGQIYTIKNNAATGLVTIATTSSQTIDGATTYLLSSQYDFVTVQSNGANWCIIAKQLQSVYTSDLTAQTAGTSFSYTTPNDAVTHAYSVAPSLRVTAYTSGTVTLTVTYTDETNTSSQATFFAQGLTTAAISAATTTGTSLNFPAMGRLLAKPNTTITMAFTYTGGTMTTNTGVTITKLN